MESHQLLERFKRRMKISHLEENQTLSEILKSSEESLKNACGDFDLSKNEAARELVIERTRYVYNDALEYFDGNFQSQITSLALNILRNLKNDVTEND